MRDRRPTIVELEALRATIAEGTTAAAARRLGRTQSSVSRALAELERRCPARLFERRGRLIEPTAEALAIDRRLDQVFAVLDGLKITKPGGDEPMHLKIAASPAFAASLLPRAFAAFRRDHPACVMHLDVMSTPDIAKRVAEEPEFMGITDSAVSSAAIRLEPFRRSSAHCNMHPDTALARRTVLTPQDLDGQRLVALARRHSMRGQIEALLASNRVKVDVVAETSTAVAALELVRAGLGIGIFNPFPLIGPTELSGVVCIPLSEDLTYLSAFVVAAHCPPTPVAKRFQTFLAGYVKTDPWSRPLKSADRTAAKARQRD
jgi:DNA-binding transcriptional LysR family regulator